MHFFSIGIIEIIEQTLAQFAAEGDDFPILDLLDVVDPDWRILGVGWNCLWVGSVDWSRGPDNTIFSLLNTKQHPPS